jgi:hypothetical protein
MYRLNGFVIFWKSKPTLNKFYWVIQNDCG